jgi:DNA end-binding protein Ku
MEYAVAPRAYWKGYLKLSLVSCPVALFPASSEREKISFNQINKQTGNRIRYRKVDAETGDEVASADISYEVGKGQYIEIQPEELEAIAIESKRTIEIDVAHASSPIKQRGMRPKNASTCPRRNRLRKTVAPWASTP